MNDVEPPDHVNAADTATFERFNGAPGWGDSGSHDYTACTQRAVYTACRVHSAPPSTSGKRKWIRGARLCLFRLSATLRIFFALRLTQPLLSLSPERESQPMGAARSTPHHLRSAAVPSVLTAEVSEDAPRVLRPIVEKRSEQIVAVPIAPQT
eukprot:722104-Prymnesium_polylepis.1